MRKFFQRNGIKIAIANIFILILLGAGFTYYNRDVMDESLVVKRETELVGKQVENVYENIRLMDISARGFALIREPQFLFWSVKNAKDHSKQTFEKLDSLFKVQNYQNPKHFEEVRKGIANYLDVYEKMVRHLENNEMDQYLAMLKFDYGKVFYETFFPFKTETEKFEARVLAKANADYEAAVRRNTIVQILLVLLGLPTLLWILYKLGKDEKGRISLLLDLDQNNRQYLFNDGSETEKEAKVILANSIMNLQRASNFVTRISESNYEVQWDGLTETNSSLNKENLAGKLMFMRDEMKKVKEEDGKRIWTTEGLSEFSEIIRKHQNDLEELTFKSLTFLVRYMKAQQGSLFTLQEAEGEESYLKLAACYAFDRRKHVDKRVNIGEGLLGQTYLEGKTLVLKTIPTGYISITSGLGHATPTCLVIVPLKHNEQVQGMLELASFNEFQPFEIAFLEKAGEFIASAIGAAQNAYRNKIMMEQLRGQTEQLRSQEEELRQNLEEMEATQEEMRRKGVALEQKAWKL